MSGPPLSDTQPVMWRESPGTTLRICGSSAFGVGKSEQRMDQPGPQAANEGARHLAQKERRGHLTAAYGVLSKATLPQGSTTRHSLA